MSQQHISDKLNYFLGAAVALNCVMTLLRALERLSVPYQLNSVEGVILNAAVLVAHGGSPYPPVGAPPFVLDAYPPVIYYAVAALVKLFGVSFLYPRLMVLVSGLMVCGLLALLLQQWTRSWRLALTFGFLFLTIPMVYPWFYMVKVDLIGLALTLGGLYLFTAWPHRWYWSIPLFALAILCKYTLVAAPGACFWYLVFRKEWKKAGALAAVMTGLTALVFFWEQSRTGGWFAFHLFRTHPQPYSLVQVWDLIDPVLRTHAVLFVLALGVVVLDWSRRAISLPVIYLLLSAVTILTAGKIGAAENHFLELLAAVCLCAGLGYGRLLEQSGAAPAAVIGGSLAFLVLTTTPFRFAKPIRPLSDCARAYAEVKNVSGERILSENVGALVLAGKPVLVSDPFVYSWMVKQSAWPDADLEEMVRSRRFDAVVLGDPVEARGSSAGTIWTTSNRWSPAVLDAIEQNYRLEKQFQCADAAYLYAPKTEATVVAAAPVSGQ